MNEDMLYISFCLYMLILGELPKVRTKLADQKTNPSKQTSTTKDSITMAIRTLPRTAIPLRKSGSKTPTTRKPTTKELSKSFDNVMKTYDKKFRPKYGETALEVELNFVVLSFGNIREVEMEFEVDLYFLQVWQDSRFNVPTINHENATIELIGSDIDQIWVPDTIFINSKKSNFHHVTLENRFMTLNLSSGEIVYHARITLTGSCHMNLRYYPFDQQTCYIALESYGHDMFDIKYKWFARGCNESCEQVSIYERNLANFDIIGAVKSTEKTTFHTAKFSSATGKFTFKRRTPYFLLQVYLPCILIVMVSWASFWIHEEAVPARSAICVTTILTIITMLGVVNVNMPKVSYVKAVDFYLFISFLMVFLSLVEYIIVLNLETFLKAIKLKRCCNDENRNVKRHSVVLMVDTDEQDHGTTHLNGYVHNRAKFEEPIRKRPKNNSRRPSLFTYKLEHTKYNNHLEGLSKEKQELLLQELLRLKEPSIVDVISRILFPVAFVIFNLCYWLIYLDQSGAH